MNNYTEKSALDFLLDIAEKNYPKYFRCDEIAGIHDYYNSTFDEEEAHLECPMCTGKLEHRETERLDAKNKDKSVSMTHAYICENCPFLGLEYIDNTDLIGLKKLIK